MQPATHSVEGFAIGIVHANVDSNPDHADDVPCSIEDLVSQEMDYRALGHIHTYTVLRPETLLENDKFLWWVFL